MQPAKKSQTLALKTRCYSVIHEDRLLFHLIAIGPLGVQEGGGNITSSLDIHQGEVNIFIIRQQQRKANHEVWVFYQICHLSMVISVLSLAIPGLSLAIPGLSLFVPSQSQDVLNKSNRPPVQFDWSLVCLFLL